jgi:flagellar biosynthesis/type III secretory pathway protein FliH
LWKNKAVPETLAIQLARPLRAASVLDAASAPEGGTVDGTIDQATGDPTEAAVRAQRPGALKDIETQQDRLAQLCQTVNRIVGNLNTLYEETLAAHRSDIAKLSVEIARKILMYKTGQGDHDIRAIVEEALKRAPTRQNITVRVNPEDFSACQQLQQACPESPLAELNVVADGGIARADCLVETPKGIVRSFIEDHLERISEALVKVQ